MRIKASAATSISRVIPIPSPAGALDAWRVRAPCQPAAMAMHLERIGGRTVAAMAVLMVLAAIIAAVW
jgi:hypothetical protein